MTIEADIALNALYDAIQEFLNSFHELDHTMAELIVEELRRHKYENIIDIGYVFMEQYVQNPWPPILYEFFHSQGAHRAKLDDLMEVYWAHQELA